MIAIPLLLSLVASEPVPNKWVIVPPGSAPAPASAPTVVIVPTTAPAPEPSRTTWHTGDPVTDELLVCALKCKDKYDKCRLDGYQDWACRMDYKRCLDRCDDDYKRRKPKKPAPKPDPRKPAPKPVTIPDVPGGAAT